MFRTILVPLDGSKSAETALPIAVRLARSEDATLVLIRVIDLANEYWSLTPSLYPSLFQSVIDTDLAVATTYLQGIAALPDLADIPVKTVVRVGVPLTAIMDTARSCEADLIILSHSHSAGIAHWMRGSNVKKIARYASIPVLILPERGGATTEYVSQIAHPLRILVPLDGSTNAKAALEPAAELLTALAQPGQKKALHLVRVVKLDSRKKADDFLHWNNEIERARYHLRQKAEWLKEGYLVPIIARQRIPVTWSIALDTDIASAVLRIAEQGEDTEGAGVFGGCDLIAMATHGRTGVQRWVMGSIAERVLAATRHPLLIVYPAKGIDLEEPASTELAHV